MTAHEIDNMASCISEINEKVIPINTKIGLGVFQKFSSNFKTQHKNTKIVHIFLFH